MNSFNFILLGLTEIASISKYDWDLVDLLK